MREQYYCIQSRLQARYVGIIFAVITLFGCGVEDASNELLNNEVDIKKVKTVYAEERIIGESVSITAEIEPFQKIDVAAEIPSQIIEIKNRIGDPVVKDQLLIILDSQDFDLAIRRAEIAKDRISLQIKKAKTDQKLAITALETQLHSLVNQYEIVLREIERKQELYNHHAIPYIELETTKDRKGTFESEIEFVREQLVAAANTDGIDLLHIQMQEAEIAYDEAIRQLKKTRIIAPINGLISNVAVIKGQNVNPGESVIRIEQHAILLAKAMIMEKDLTVVHENNSFDIIIPVLNKTVTGKVSYVSPSISQNQSGFLLELVIDNDEGKIRPGMNAQLILNVDLAKPTITVPVGSVLRKNGGQYVYIVEGNRAKKQMVSIGRETREYVEVLDGVLLGDIIVNVGQSLLQDGDAVQVLE